MQAAVTSTAMGIASGVEVDTVRGTSLVELSYIVVDARRARARIANAVADAYIDWNMEQKFRALGETSEFLTTQIDTLKKELADPGAAAPRLRPAEGHPLGRPAASVDRAEARSVQHRLRGGSRRPGGEGGAVQAPQNASPESIADTVSGSCRSSAPNSRGWSASTPRS